MVALAAGATVTQAYGALQALRIDVPVNCNGTITFTPLDVSTGDVIGSSSEEGNSRRFGPHAEKFTFGPMGIYGRYTLVNDPRSAASIDYTATTVTVGSNVTQGATTITGTLNASGAFSTNLNPSSTGQVNISPTGTGTVTIAPVTTGNINNMNIGQTTRALMSASQVDGNYYRVNTYSDTSGTPGNATIDLGAGRCAFAAAGTAVVVTNSLCTATSIVMVTLRTVDATLKYVTATTAAGSFTVTGNAAATATTVFDWFLVRN